MENLNNFPRIITFKNARIKYRNFRGEARQYNQEGMRNFNLVLNAEDAQRLAEMGMSVRIRPPRNEGDEPERLLKVAVSYKIRAPKIVVISGGVQTALDEDTVDELDYADIERVDLSIRPSRWSMPDGRTGLKAYLNTMYVTVVEDELEREYQAADRIFATPDIPFTHDTTGYDPAAGPTCSGEENPF